MREPAVKTNMAEDERSPLLSSAEPNALDISSPRQIVKGLYESEQVLGRHSPYTGTERETISISTSSSALNVAEEDRIVAIFVVAFDTKAGNTVEWCMPENVDLEGVEFKAMTSGSHTLTRDFVYFKKGNTYGLACFENMPVESEVERGARMKSVGILATSYTLLYRHMQFLENQVRHQLELPERYGQLKAFWEDKKGVLPMSTPSNGLPPLTPVSSPNSDIILPELKITHPMGCFTQFIQFFGEQIFVLWKYALLGQRILFFSPPPIGNVCYRVYCACCLGQHSLRPTLINQTPVPHFYVNVADIESLETEMAYVACTTEKIFETKTHLYDVYVDNQCVRTPSPHLRELLKTSQADRDKLTKLNNQRASQQYNLECGEEVLAEEEIFTAFFLEQNNRLLQTLLDVSASQDKQLTSDHMRSMGLDPQGDRTFLMELVETYGIDVMLMVDNPCCPR